MPVSVNESGLEFILDSERLFLPENEAFYKKLSSKDSIKICDIIFLADDDRLLIIEVKSSSPQRKQRICERNQEKVC